MEVFDLEAASIRQNVAEAVGYTPVMPELAPTPRNLFSFSRLKTFHQCALRYRYRYLEGMREAFRSVESLLGTVTHDVLEWLYAHRDQGRSPELGETLEEFARRWTESLAEDVAVVRVADSADASFRVGREMLGRFHRTTFRRDRSETVALEKRLSTRLSPRVLFTGFADRVGRTVGGRLFVVDYKTSRTEGNATEFSEGLQAPLYAACALDEHGAEEALAGYHYLRPGTTRWLRVDEAAARSVLDRFLVLADQALGAAEFPANPGVLCAWCGFNHLCPAARVPDDLVGGLRLARGAPVRRGVR